MTTRPDASWTGHWVAQHLGVDLVATPGDPPAVGDLVGLAVRRNPRRAHLLVSRVLGKHVPTDPRLVRAAGALLGRRVRAVLAGTPSPAAPAALRRALDGDRDAATELRDATCAGAAAADCLVLGYAETATGLGHVVADALDAAYLLHSTRRDVGEPFGGFSEEHSHAADHLLRPADPSALTPDVPLVLVDDELSTGRTAAATIGALHARAPRARYVVAALVDVRAAEAHGGPARDDLTEVAAALGVRIDVVALARGVVAVPADVLDRGRRLAGTLVAPPGRTRGEAGTLTTVWLDPRAGVADGARHGLDRAARHRLAAALPADVDRVADAVGLAPGRTLVLGTEELMYLPLRLAEGLADRVTAPATVDFSSTTRSPVLPVDDPGYAIRSSLTFPVTDGPTDGPTDAPRFAHNVGTGHDTVVLVVDTPARSAALHAPGGLVTQLRARASRVVEVVVPPRRSAPPALRRTARPEPPPVLRGPCFGSYAADEVGWLLTDLSAETLEAPTADREAGIRAGTAHYAESLPVEYRPSPAYEALFRAALARSAARLADAVGLVTDQVLATRRRPVLVSLARAGTPVGILMRRWAARVRGVEAPHYAVSIVRDRGVDDTALAALATWYDPADVVFVDGWTGKGAIRRELTAALAAHRAAHGTVFDDALAVLADPGHVTTVTGTREDFLVPSACLNATVSGLVSRTVLRPDLLGPGAYHGAKAYPELAGVDVSGSFLDAVSAHFPPAGATASPRPPSDPPDGRGLRFVAALGARLGVDDLHLVKPGVGETTRVLLRRAPDRVLLAPGAGEDVEHVRLLCAERGVPVLDLPAELDGVPSPYVCIGVIDDGRRGRQGRQGPAGPAVNPP